MSTPLESVYELKCSCNQYPWGKQGSESIAARLCSKQPGWDGDGPQKDFKIDESKPYAEMWFGTYPDLPSYISSTSEDLQSVLDRYPSQLLGDAVLKKFGHSNLPFLPKVLSISKALPLQLHPNKELAAKLHKEDPDQFTDPNHKPEIAIALSKFEAFCGFKPLADIAKLLSLEPLQGFVEQSKLSSFSDQDLKAVVRKMLLASVEDVKKIYSQLTSLPASSFGPEGKHIQDLCPRLAEQYDESDPGILVALITMNYLVLEAGESIYIPADGIHAYLGGDIIECMARSNNVLNTGFCPRASRNSIDLFMSCLTFTPHSAEESMLRPKPYPGSKHGKTQLYAPPLSEFDMLQMKLEKGEKEVLNAIGGPTVFVATKGSATLKASGKGYEVREGGIFFVACGTEMEFESGGEGFLGHFAFVEGGTK